MRSPGRPLRTVLALLLLSVSACSVLFSFDQYAGDPIDPIPDAHDDSGHAEGASDSAADASAATQCDLADASNFGVTLDFVACGDAGMRQLARDSQHCGECFRACDDGVTCNEGQCAPQLVGATAVPTYPGAWVGGLSAGRLRWYGWDRSTGPGLVTFGEMTLDGKSSIVRGVAFGDTRGYAHSSDGDYAASFAQIVFAPESGGDAIVRVDQTGGKEIGSLAVGGAYGYFRSGDDLAAFARNAGPGAAPAQIIFVGESPFALYADDERVYWFSNVGGTFAKSSPHGRWSPEVLAQIDGDVRFLGASEAYLYWVDVGARSLRRLLKRGGPVETMAQAPIVAGEAVRGIEGLAVDADFVYWTLSQDDPSKGGETGSFTLLRTPRCGGITRILARYTNPQVGKTAALGIAVDGRHVYYGTIENTVLRTSK